MTPSVAFIDLLLPGTSGLEVLEHIHNQPLFDQMLRIVLTNLSDFETIKRAYSLGAKSFLIKPIAAADVRELIEAFPGHWSVNVVMNPFGTKPPQKTTHRLGKA